MYIIHYTVCPRDDQDMDIWRKFLKQVEVQLVTIFDPDPKVDTPQSSMPPII